MSTDDPDPPEDETDVEPADLRAELDRQRSDVRPDPGTEGIVDLLSAAFDTDKRTRVYVGLRQRPDSTPEALAEETGLYPATVERVLSDLEADGVVERRVGTGNGERYTAVPPQEAVDVVFGRVQDTVDEWFSLGGRRDPLPENEPSRSSEPVTIPVEEASDDDGDDR